MGVHALCGQCAILFDQYNNVKIFLDSIQSLENPGVRHICVSYL